MATYKDRHPAAPGPLFHKLKVLMIFDIFKVQLGKLIYESVNNIVPTNKVIIYILWHPVYRGSYLLPHTIFCSCFLVTRFRSSCIHLHYKGFYN